MVLGRGPKAWLQRAPWGILEWLSALPCLNPSKQKIWWDLKRTVSEKQTQKTSDLDEAKNLWKHCQKLVWDRSFGLIAAQSVRAAPHQAVKSICLRYSYFTYLHFVMAQSCAYLIFLLTFASYLCIQRRIQTENRCGVRRRQEAKVTRVKIL